MLKICRKGGYEAARGLTAEEDRALRRAFGRFADPKARGAGAAVVRRYQHEGPGNWFLCDCLSEGQRPPALVPVLESFIRRHGDAPWPMHAEGCDFARDPAEQRLVTESYARPAAGPARLVRRYANEDEERVPWPPEAHGYARRRESLATLLMRLASDAGLMHIRSGVPLAKLGDQFRALRLAARSIEIDRGQALAPFLCTYLPGLPELMERIGRSPPSRFPGSRPHGVLLTIITGVGQGTLMVDPQTHLPVHGRISVFGEPDGNGRDTPGHRSVRAPYLAVCLIGRPTKEEPVALLRAYAHPCASQRHLMLVDSNFERRTLYRLISLQRWLAGRLGIAVDIEKPCFDIAPDSADPALAPVHEPCIPDFILRASPVPAGGADTVIVESMGYGDALYRTRKQLAHARMSAALEGAVVIEHDLHRPAELTQDERDRRFWLEARWQISGPAGAKSRPEAAERVQSVMTGARP